MKLRLSLLVATAAILAILLGLDWRARHPTPQLDRFDFLPVLKGLKVSSGRGDLINGRTDWLDSGGRRQEIMKTLREAGWTESKELYNTLFTPVAPTGGYGFLRVGVLQRPSYPKAVNVGDEPSIIVIRRVGAVTADESAAHNLLVESSKAAVTRVREMLPVIESKHKLGAADLDFLIRQTRYIARGRGGKPASDFAEFEWAAFGKVGESTLIVRELADIDLGGLAQVGGISPDRYDEAVLESLGTAEPGMAGLSLMTYTRSLGLPIPVGRHFSNRERDFLFDQKLGNSLDESERSLINQALSSKEAGAATYAAVLLGTKARLDPESRTFALDALDRELSRTSGNAHAAWKRIRKLVEARNPA